MMYLWKKNPEDISLKIILNLQHYQTFIVLIAELVYKFNFCSIIKLSYYFVKQSPW